mmetsp:Transcript_38458/g.62506  ORF Transcript_38458/g.62506 Transcript_38458/m.62506 type:complete len:295 (+) Transcript_38458:60-944(+)
MGDIISTGGNASVREAREARAKEHPMEPGPTGWKVDKVFAGKIRSYDKWYRGARSGIDKEEIKGEVEVNELGILQDQQARTSHGGPGRALLHFAHEHYVRIEEIYKKNGAEIDFPRLVAPGFGENISTSCGMNERTVCIGDEFELGSAIIRVTQPRAPCFHLNHRFSCNDRKHLLSSTVEVHCMAGWLYAVVKPGKFKEGDEFVLKKRPLPHIPVAYAHQMVSKQEFPEEDVKFMAECTLLDPKWRKFAKARISAKNAPVSMSARLLGGKKGAHIPEERRDPVGPKDNKKMPQN